MTRKHIIAIILQELFITKRSFEVIVDLFYFSIINLVVFGFVSLYLTGQKSSTAAQFLLLGMILFEVIRVTQYSISVGSLWNIWARNLSNMFVAPLTTTEYMLAEMITGLLRTVVDIIVVSLIAFLVFHFSILSVGILNLLLFFINLTIFSWSVGIIIVGLIFRFGTRIQALAWSFIFLLQPLCAVFFPVSVLPKILQYFSYIFPPTYVFEAGRQSLLHHNSNLFYAGISFLLNLCYFALSLWFFNKMFFTSKVTGQFARNEG